MMADVKPLPLPSLTKHSYDDDDDDNILYASKEDLHQMSEIPWDLRGASGGNMDALSSDEELLDFTSNQTRLVLNSSSDDDLINVAPDEIEQQHNVNNENAKLSRFQRCFRQFASHVGLFYAFISSIFFAITVIFVKMLTGKLNSVEILFWRFLFTLILIIPPIVYKRPVLLVTKKQLLLLLIRTVVGATALGLLYTACQMMEVGDANAIFFCNPIFTVIFACVLLKEGCCIWDVLLSILSIGGVFLVTRPPFIFQNKDMEDASNKSQILGSLLSLVGALFAATTFITLRIIGKSVHYLTIVFYYSLFSIIITAILISSLQWWTLPDCGKDRLLLFGTGVFSFLGQIFLTRAFQCEKAGYVSVMRTNDVTVSFILQFVVFGTTPYWTSIVGAVLIVSSSVGINVRKWMARKDESVDQGDGDNGDGNRDDSKPEEEMLDEDHNYEDNRVQET